MVVGITGYWLHLNNVCIGKKSNSSLQQQQQILYLLRHNSVQESIAWYYAITLEEGVNSRVHVYTITSDTSLRNWFI